MNSMSRDPWLWTTEDFRRWAGTAPLAFDRKLWKALADNECNGEMFLTKIDYTNLYVYLNVDLLRDAIYVMKNIEHLRKQSAIYTSSFALQDPSRPSHDLPSAVHPESSRSVITQFEDFPEEHGSNVNAVEARWFLLSDHLSHQESQSCILPAVNSILNRTDNSDAARPSTMSTQSRHDSLKSPTPRMELTDTWPLEQLSTLSSPPSTGEKFSDLCEAPRSADHSSDEPEMGFRYPEKSFHESESDLNTSTSPRHALRAEDYLQIEPEMPEVEATDLSFVSIPDTRRLRYLDIEKTYVQRTLRRAFMNPITHIRSRKSSRSIWPLHRRQTDSSTLSLVVTERKDPELLWLTKETDYGEEPQFSTWFQEIDWEKRLQHYAEQVDDTELPPFGESDSDGVYESDVMEEIDAEVGENIELFERTQDKAAPLAESEVQAVLARCEVQMAQDWRRHPYARMQTKSYMFWKRFHRLDLLGRRARRKQLRYEAQELVERRQKLRDYIYTITFLSERAVEQQAESMRETIYQVQEQDFLLHLYDENTKCPTRQIRSIAHQDLSGHISMDSDDGRTSMQDDGYDSENSVSDDSRYTYEDIDKPVLDIVSDESMYEGESEESAELETDHSSEHLPSGPSASSSQKPRLPREGALSSQSSDADGKGPNSSYVIISSDSEDAQLSARGSGVKTDNRKSRISVPADSRKVVFATTSDRDESPASLQTPIYLEIPNSGDEAVGLGQPAKEDKTKEAAHDHSQPQLNQANKRPAAASQHKKHKKHKRSKSARRLINSDSESEDLVGSSKSKKKRKKRPINEHATIRRRQQQAEREVIFQRAQEQANLENDGQRTIINPGDVEVGESIAIDDTLAQQLKAHQLDGVRFMWRETIMMSEVTGCLLAHTMGLGKTLQVITYLDTLGHVITTSKNWLPRELRRPHALIICPASLVRNWTQELRHWTPNNALGRVFDPALDASPKYRLQTLREWRDLGGIAVLSYHHFTAIIINKSKSLPDSEVDEVVQEMKEIVQNTPRVVVADEAHMFKNDLTALAKAVRTVKTKARIALTGSPLANNLMEYWAIMDWIDNGYLGSKQDFRAEHVRTIEDGNKHDASRSEIRQGQKQLKVLLGIIGSKIERKNVDCLRSLLPSKFEYVLFLRFSDLQRTLYNSFLTALHVSKETTLAQLLVLLSRLRWICNWPKLIQPEYTQNLAARAATKRLAKDDNQNQLPNVADIETQENVQDSVTETWRRDILLKFASQLNDCQTSAKIIILLKICRAARTRGDKVLVFSFSIPTIKCLSELLATESLGPIHTITGARSAGHRVKDVHDFNNLEGFAICLISTKAGGQGLNMVGANRVILFDHEFNPVWAEQAVGRAYRMGQKKDVFVYRLQIDGSFEIRLFQQALRKLGLTSKVVDKRNIQTNIKSQYNLLQYFQHAPPSDRAPDPIATMEDSLLSTVLQECHELILSVEKTESFHVEEGNELDADDLVEIQLKQDQHWKNQEQRKGGNIVSQPVVASNSHSTTLPSISSVPRFVAPIPSAASTSGRRCMYCGRPTVVEYGQRVNFVCPACAKPPPLQHLQNQNATAERYSTKYSLSTAPANTWVTKPVRPKESAHDQYSGLSTIEILQMRNRNRSMSGETSADHKQAPAVANESALVYDSTPRQNPPRVVKPPEAPETAAPQTSIPVISGQQQVKNPAHNVQNSAANVDLLGALKLAQKHDTDKLVATKTTEAMTVADQAADISTPVTRPISRGPPSGVTSENTQSGGSAMSAALETQRKADRVASNNLSKVIPESEGIVDEPVTTSETTPAGSKSQNVSVAPSRRTDRERDKSPLFLPDYDA